jgi:2-methylisocitrate lyase-like PEP mutase family enzyme
LSSQAERGARFRALHEGELFIIPNPWDAGTARGLEALGFEALATTSAGLAFTHGRLDGGVTLADVAQHTAALAAATNLPVSVDLENGYGRQPADAAAAIRAVAEAGAVGASIEDFDPEDGIYEIRFAAERIAAAAESARNLGYDFTLTGRAENFIRGNPDLQDTIARLQSYESAGADVLYAPGLTSPDDVRAVCEAVTKPVNVLGLPMMSLEEITAAGARRVSVGSQLTWVAVEAFTTAAKRLRDGDLGALVAKVEIREWFG